jgi:hypothetical protein
VAAIFEFVQQYGIETVVAVVVIFMLLNSDIAIRYRGFRKGSGSKQQQ